MGETYGSFIEKCRFMGLNKEQTNEAINAVHELSQTTLLTIDEATEKVLESIAKGDTLMKHEFTDDQINDAKHAAARYMGRDWISRFNVIDIRAVLDVLYALPEPKQDVWQTCLAKNVRKGDRVRWKVSESEDNESYEIVVTVVTNHSNDGGVVLHSKSCSYFFPYDTVVDRIPAPVTHPDPAEHKVILDSSGNSWFWSGKDNEYYSPTFPNAVKHSDGFSDWSPAKVVETNE